MWAMQDLSVRGFDSAQRGLGIWPSRGFLSKTHSLSMCSDKLYSYTACPIRCRPCNQLEELCGPCPGCESFLCAIKLSQALYLKVSSNVMEEATLNMGSLIQRPWGACLLCPSNTLHAHGHGARGRDHHGSLCTLPFPRQYSLGI